MLTRAERARDAMPFDVIIVGSGFGGSVCAARLAERGMRVLVVERGPWWGPLQRDRPAADRREYPRGPLGVRKLVRNVRIARAGRRRERLYCAGGLLEAHLFDHLGAVTASGVGGGSHIYTSILEEPPPELFDAYPEAITAAEMRPYYDRVRAILRPSPVPERPPKDLVFEDAVAAAGLGPVEYPSLAIAWGRAPDRPERVANAAGVVQSTSTYTSDVLVGCEDGSKTTLDLTYVPLALRHGAELRPFCEVTQVGADEGSYYVRYFDHRSGEHLLERTPRLVLAAGGLNTQRLLFAARDRHASLPAISQQLGRRFSPNGDLLWLLYDTHVLHDSSYGTSFNAFVRVNDHEDQYRFLVGEVGLPLQALPAPRFARGRLRRSTLLLTMGRDASNGSLGFDGRGLVSDVGRSMDRALYDAMEETLGRVARHYGARRSITGLRRSKDAEEIFTVHPLGGCAMADSALEGVTDHVGQVFGYPGLYVADGSLYPRSPGIAPSLTIAAIAERQAHLLR